MNRRLMCVCIAAALTAAICIDVTAQEDPPRISVATQDNDAQTQTPTSPGELLGALQLVRLDLAIDEAPLRTVMTELRGILGINIVVRYRTDRILQGLDPDALITLHGEHLPARVVLEMILDQAADVEQATWQLRTGFVEAGPKSRLNVQKEVRVYSVDDLLFEPAYFGPETGYGAPQQIPTQGVAPAYGTSGFGVGYGGIGFSAPIYQPGPFFRQPPSKSGASSRSARVDLAQDLTDMIVRTVEPHLWEANGGNVASMHYRDGALIVRAPDYVHRMVAGYSHRLVPPPEHASDAVAEPSD